MKTIELLEGEVVTLVIKQSHDIPDTESTFVVGEDGLIDVGERAHKLGRRHGINAGSWYFERDTAPDYKAVLKGIEDGDPEVLDSLPGTPLSGEFADSMTPQKLLERIGVDFWVGHEQERPGGLNQNESEFEAHLCDLYEDGFREGVEFEITNTCRFHVEEG